MNVGVVDIYNKNNAYKNDIEQIAQEISKFLMEKNYLEQCSLEPVQPNFEMNAVPNNGGIAVKFDNDLPIILLTAFGEVKLIEPEECELGTLIQEEQVKENFEKEFAVTKLHDANGLTIYAFNRNIAGDELVLADVLEIIKNNGQYFTNNARLLEDAWNSNDVKELGSATKEIAGGAAPSTIGVTQGVTREEPLPAEEQHEVQETTNVHEYSMPTKVMLSVLGLVFILTSLYSHKNKFGVGTSNSDDNPPPPGGPGGQPGVPPKKPEGWPDEDERQEVEVTEEFDESKKDSDDNSHGRGMNGINGHQGQDKDSQDKAGSSQGKVPKGGRLISKREINALKHSEEFSQEPGSNQCEKKSENEMYEFKGTWKNLLDNANKFVEWLTSLDVINIQSSSSDASISLCTSCSISLEEPIIKIGESSVINFVSADHS